MIVYTVITGQKYDPYLPIWVEAVKRNLEPDKIICLGTSWLSRKPNPGVTFAELEAVGNTPQQKSRYLKIRGLDYCQDFACPVLYLDLDLLIQKPMGEAIRTLDYQRAIYLCPSIYKTVGELLAHKKSFRASNPGLDVQRKLYNSGLILYHPFQVNCAQLFWAWLQGWLSGGQGFDQLHLLHAIDQVRLKIEDLPREWNTPVLNPQTVGWHDFGKVTLL